MNILLSTLVTALLALVTMPAKANDLMELEELVDEARLTYARFVRHPEMPWFRDQVKEAKGVFIMPNFFEAGYVVGGSFGKGVLLFRNEVTGQWNGPAFYDLVGGTVGLEFGVSSSEIVALVMTKEGVESLLSTSFIMGSGATVAAGSIGGGLSGGLTPNLTADFITFAGSKGAIVNLSVGGTVVRINKKANRLYYGKPADPVEIVVNGEVSNRYSNRLRTMLTRTTSGELPMR